MSDRGTDEAMTPEERHRERMQRKKALIDRKIASATIDRGVLVVNTGNGKGKSSSGFGMLARSLGHGFKCGVVQFIKGSFSTGEEAFFRQFEGVGLDYHVMGEGFTWETQDKARDIAAAQAAWQVAAGMLADPSYDFVLLDEVASAAVGEVSTARRRTCRSCSSRRSACSARNGVATGCRRSLIALFASGRRILAACDLGLFAPNDDGRASAAVA